MKSELLYNSRKYKECVKIIRELRIHMKKYSFIPVAENYKKKKKDVTKVFKTTLAH